MEMNENDELLTRGVANIIPGKKELKGRLDNGKKINVYLGIDPTATKIHLGHAVPLRKLNELAKRGHNVTFLIGDFTALIGDTSDKDAERPALTNEEIEENFKNYKRQAEKILDFSLVKIRYNSEWLKPLNFEDILKLAQHFSVGDFVGRELVKKRLSDGKRVGLHEFLYPVMQAYDSFILDTDLQIGGTDQTFNMQAGRSLIKDKQGRESFVLSTPLLEGTDGRKMSKSWGNAIWLEDNPSDMYAKVMAVKDDLIITYFTLGTSVETIKIKEYAERLKKENPINIKKELALEIVRELHNEKSAKEAQAEFESRVQNKELPDEIKSLKINAGDNLTATDVLSGIGLKSRSETKRLIEQKGITLDEKTVTDPNIELKHGQTLKIGKRKIFRVEIK
jgi:tyrosyl-tRNA synthetase